MLAATLPTAPISPGVAAPPVPTMATTAPLASHLLNIRESFLAFIMRRVSDPELAEDILQESLLRALQATPSVRDEERLVPWFYRILRHAIVDAYRRRRAVERRHTDATDMADAEAYEPRVEIELDDAVPCACLHDLIPALKPEYAVLLRSLDLEGTAPEAAARWLGLTPTNLKVCRHRARQALRRRLEQHCCLVPIAQAA